jgi:hypothetical protein
MEREDVEQLKYVKGVKTVRGKWREAYPMAREDAEQLKYVKGVITLNWKRSVSVFVKALVVFVLAFQVFLRYYHSLPWYEQRMNYATYFSFPERTIDHTSVSISGFLADKRTTLVAHISPEKSRAFIETLREKGFSESTVPEDIQEMIACDSETRIVAGVTGLWWFQDESLKGFWAKYADYTFHIYDPETYTYYYIEYGPGVFVRMILLPTLFVG